MPKWYPFAITLSGLCLKGKQRDIAEAYYNLEGYELEEKLIEIEASENKKLQLIELNRKYDIINDIEYEQEIAEATYSGDELCIKLLEIKHNHKLISTEDFEYQYGELRFGINSKEWQLVKLDLDRKYNKIDDNKYDKAVYSLANKPWVGVASSEYEPGDKSDGFTFELDWNSAFIDVLRGDGYTGPTEESIIEQWFEDKSLDGYVNILAEEIDEMENIPSSEISNYRNNSLKERMKNNKTRHS